MRRVERSAAAALALAIAGGAGCGAGAERAGAAPPARSSERAAASRSPEPVATIRRVDGATITSSELDATVTRLMAEAHVPGLALAILVDGRVVHLRGYGVRNADTGAPLTVDAVMVGASFTKAAFAVAVMQLVAEGVLDLDVPIVRYLAITDLADYRDLAGDPRVGRITARMLLDHTSGLPNWRRFNDDGRLDLAGEPGARFSYSGEGIVILQRVVERLTGQSAADLMRTRVFAPLGMTRTSLVWQPALAAEAAVGHGNDGRVLGHDRRDHPDAAGSMDTTIRDWAAFLAALHRRQLLDPAGRGEMLRPQIRIRSARQFPPRAPETTTDNDGIALSYGLGWGLFSTPRGRAFFKEGHDEGWQHHTVVFDDAGVAIAIMTNSDNGDRTFRALLAALGDTYTPWRWEGYAAEP